MLVIYDLDKTSLYCPLANFMDKFIPSNLFLRKLYYSLYPFIHWVEIKLKLIQINYNMTNRARAYHKLKAKQIVVTARHKTKATIKHAKLVFPDVPMNVICVAQGITGYSKAEYLNLFENINTDEEILMFDDNWKELSKMRFMFKNRFKGIRVLFKDNKEKIYDN